VFIGADYEKSEWCGLEWRAIRELIKKRKSNSIMFVRVGAGNVEGLMELDGYIDASKHEASQIADFILERVKSVSLDETNTTPEPAMESPEFEGQYVQRTTGMKFLVEKLSEYSYQINTDDWVGIAFWNKQANNYFGVFCYRDTPSLAGPIFSKNGAFENAAGYHLYEPISSQHFQVTFQWGLEPASGRGTFIIDRQ